MSSADEAFVNGGHCIGGIRWPPFHPGQQLGCILAGKEQFWNSCISIDLKSCWWTLLFGSKCTLFKFCIQRLWDVPCSFVQNFVQFSIGR